MTYTTRGDESTAAFAYREVEPNPREHRLKYAVVRDGLGYSVHATNLQGCVSQGDTIRECVANIKEAFIGCVMSYDSAGDPIPFSDVDMSWADEIVRDGVLWIEIPDVQE